MFADILRIITDTVFGLLTLAFLARFFMQWARVSFRNPIGQFVVVATDWAVTPLRRFIPGLFGLDMASLIAALLTQLVNAALDLAIAGAPASMLLVYTPVVGLVGLLRMAIWLVFGVILVAVVLSWVAAHSPMAAVFDSLSRPLLAPFRRLIPPLGGIDFSPLVLLLILQILLRVVDELPRMLLT
ncbi:MAG: YggT family protein [Azoarcus sp.]|jgi:YggT family protein|nr:YggT family protein [Azoarcus sp.]